MRIIGVRVTNYGRFKGDHELDLQPGVYAVVARDAANPQRSNWLGKSTLLSVIRWVLYGKLPTQWKALDDAISRGAQEMAVDMEFSDGMFITRSKRRGQSAQLRVLVPKDGGGEVELKQDQAQEVILARVGLGLIDFDYTAWLGQKSMARIVNADPADRTAVVNEWFSLGPLQHATELVGEMLGDVGTKLVRLEADYTTAQQFCTVDRGGLVTAVEEAERVLEVESTRVGNGSLVAVRHQAWVEEQSRHLAVAAAKQAVQELEEREPKMVVLQSQLERVAAHHTRAKQRFAQADAEVERLEALRGGKFDGRCPIICAACPVAEQVEASKVEIEAALYKALDFEKGTVVWAKRWNNHEAKLVTRKREWQRWEDQLRMAVNRVQVLEQLCKHKVLPPEPEKPDEVPSREEEYTRTLTRAEAELQQWDKAKADTTRLGKELEGLAWRKDLLQRLLRVYGKGGAQRRIATAALGQIQAIANAILRRSDIALQVEIEYGRELGEIAAVCGCGHAYPRSAAVKVCPRCGNPRGKKRDEKLYVHVTPYSGAAEDLAGVAVQLAAARWRRAARGTQWAVVCIDEPFGALDAHNRAGLARSLAQMVSDGFEQGFVIAHSDDVLDALPHRLLITGDGEWSRVAAV